MWTGEAANITIHMSSYLHHRMITFDFVFRASVFDGDNSQSESAVFYNYVADDKTNS